MKTHLKIFENIDKAKRAFIRYYESNCDSSWEFRRSELRLFHPSTNTNIFFRSGLNCTKSFYSGRKFDTIEGEHYLPAFDEDQIKMRIKER